MQYFPSPGQKFIDVSNVNMTNELNSDVALYAVKLYVSHGKCDHDI